MVGSKLVEEQLRKCVIADVSNYDADRHCIVIKKYSKPNLEVGKSYYISLPDGFANNNDSVFSINWNNCTSPKDKNLCVSVTRKSGKMAFIDSVGYDVNSGTTTGNYWSGWVSSDEISIIK